ncbi:hypothetical protein SORBI_3001G100300 [Sorghum bicolor]|uniref:Uncharacterized protein n=1 Tax=Sorghum bicolor TaxID=4558 RepID=A0A1B6QI93_SORBI|nr:hypothetical protein SORBI_3001G100300 [Sorghum bicolor]
MTFLKKIPLRIPMLHNLSTTTFSCASSLPGHALQWSFSFLLGIVTHMLNLANYFRNSISVYRRI